MIARTVIPEISIRRESIEDSLLQIYFSFPRIRDAAISYNLKRFEIAGEKREVQEQYHEFDISQRLSQFEFGVLQRRQALNERKYIASNLPLQKVISEMQEIISDFPSSFSTMVLNHHWREALNLYQEYLYSKKIKTICSQLIKAIDDLYATEHSYYVGKGYRNFKQVIKILNKIKSTRALKLIELLEEEIAPLEFINSDYQEEVHLENTLKKLKNIVTLQFIRRKK